MSVSLSFELSVIYFIFFSTQCLHSLIDWTLLSLLVQVEGTESILLLTGSAYSGQIFLYPYEFSCQVCWHLCFNVLDHGPIFKTKSVCSKYSRSSHIRIWLKSQIVPIVKLHERGKILGKDVAENMLRERCRWEINSGGGEQDRPRRQGRFVGGGVLKWAHPGCSCSAGNHRACGSQSIAISALSSFPAPWGGVQC